MKYYRHDTGLYKKHDFDYVCGTSAGFSIKPIEEFTFIFLELRKRDYINLGVHQLTFTTAKFLLIKQVAMTTVKFLSITYHPDHDPRSTERQFPPTDIVYIEL